LSGHVNIVQFIAAASIGKEESGHGQSEFLILTELCTGLYNVLITSFKVQWHLLLLWKSFVHFLISWLF